MLSCDVSPMGLVLCCPNGFQTATKKPIAYTSRSLAVAEIKCAQIKMEGLAIMFGVKKFHSYLLGRRFTVYSDHKPLLSEAGPVGVMASAWIQRWVLTLST